MDAKATKGKTGTAGAKGPVRRSPTGTGLRVGEAVAVRPATSEIMDATAGETAPKFDRGRFLVFARGGVVTVTARAQV